MVGSTFNSLRPQTFYNIHHTSNNYSVGENKEARENELTQSPARKQLSLQQEEKESSWVLFKSLSSCNYEQTCTGFLKYPRRTHIKSCCLSVSIVSISAVRILVTAGLYLGIVLGIKKCLMKKKRKITGRRKQYLSFRLFVIWLQFYSYLDLK